LRNELLTRTFLHLKPKITIAENEELKQKVIEQKLIQRILEANLKLT
jgi:hypothetical protein